MLVLYVISVAASVLLTHVTTGFEQPLYAALPLFAAAVICFIPFAIVMLIRLIRRPAIENSDLFRVSGGVYVFVTLFTLFVSPVAIFIVMMLHLMSDLSI